MIYGAPQEIKTQITITALYEDCVRITVHDVNSGLSFIEMELTKEQFVDAAMNRLGNCEVEKTTVRSLDLVGKTREMKQLEFKLPDGTNYHNLRQMATDEINRICPEGWVPETSFSSRESFFTKSGEEWARTHIRRWV